MKTIAAVGAAFLVAASGCGSASGATGGTGTTATTDTGSTFAYSSRDQVDCYTAVMDSNPAVLEVRAACQSADDLPLVGSCSLGETGNYTLVSSAPAGWDLANSSGGPAEWRCRWARDGQLVNVPSAQAWICCVVKSRAVARSR
jgi:hypothetical protein